MSNFSQFAFYTSALFIVPSFSTKLGYFLIRIQLDCNQWVVLIDIVANCISSYCVAII